MVVNNRSVSTGKSVWKCHAQRKHVEAETNNQHLADDVLHSFYSAKIAVFWSELYGYPMGTITNMPALVQITSWRWQAIIWTKGGIIYWGKHASLRHNVLTHWGRDKIPAIFQTTFSNGFLWMKMHEFQLKFHWSLFLEVKLTIFSTGSDNGLAPTRRQAIIWTNDSLDHRCTYASLGLNELSSKRQLLVMCSVCSFHRSACSI